MIKLYANENFPLAGVVVLRELGYDVLTTFEAVNAGLAIPDEDVLQIAIENNRALITLNRKHFIKLHKQNQQHFGIIVCTFDPDFSAQAIRIDEILNQANIDNQLIRITRG